MKKVIASLQYGYLARESDAARFFIGLITATLCLAYAVTICMVGCILAGEIVIEEDGSIIGALVGMDILATALFIVPIFLLINEKRTRKLIESWQDDFVETTATVIDESVVYGVGRIMRIDVKLIVKFVIDGKAYKKKSEFKRHKLSAFALYGSMRKLAGDGVPIYYSKKHDQVVFIKWN
ncbi:MAG: hypothetical protein K2M36_01255 [Clostridia bacterium]|nr:hypothetical protein [Clostridia bacterium]